MDKRKKLRISKETLGGLSSTRLAAAQGAKTNDFSCLASCHTCQYTCIGSVDICCA